MILVSQDGFKACNMAHIKSFDIFEDNVGNFPTLPTNNENHVYIIWIDNEGFGKFKKLEDAQNVFTKLTSITNTAAEGVVIIKEKSVDFFGKEPPTWRCKPNADNQK